MSDSNQKPDYDSELQAIADYVLHYTISDQGAYYTARLCLLDALSCGLKALEYPACTKLIGPIVPEMKVTPGARVPGTSYELDPITAAFNIGLINRWLDFNDTWLAAEWGHPSDNLGGILAVADYLNRRSEAPLRLTMRDVLTALIKAYEIQGILALKNSFNRVGLDHVILVKVATIAVIIQLLGGNREKLLAALSQAWLDGHSLRTYRHAPNTGSRKSWAAGDATSRAVYLALLTVRGEEGYPSVLSAKIWGFYDVLFKGQSFKFPQAYAHYVIDHILFKISYPAEFHAQTAVECAIHLHQQYKNRLSQIEKIIIYTQQAAMRIINKSGPLHNPADRDHCLQYMVAIGLLYGDLRAEHYQDSIAQEPNIDRLRAKMQVVEDLNYTQDYYTPDKRSIANAIQLFFTDGTKSEKVCIEYPIGHKRRRNEGLPLLDKKFKASLDKAFSQSRAEQVYQLCNDQPAFEAMPVDRFMDLWVK